MLRVQAGVVEQERYASSPFPPPLVTKDDGHDGVLGADEIELVVPYLAQDAKHADLVMTVCVSVSVSVCLCVCVSVCLCLCLCQCQCCLFD